MIAQVTYAVRDRLIRLPPLGELKGLCFRLYSFCIVAKRILIPKFGKILPMKHTF